MNLLEDLGRVLIHLLVVHKDSVFHGVAAYVDMRDGQYIGTWDAKGLTTDFIITKMVGRELSNLFPKRADVDDGDPFLPQLVDDGKQGLHLCGGEG